jgi:hypothetical protein
MGVVEVERIEGVGGIETVLVRLWKCVEKVKTRTLEKPNTKRHRTTPKVPNTSYLVKGRPTRSAPARHPISPRITRLR